jgi:hypothetical protein
MPLPAVVIVTPPKGGGVTMTCGGQVSHRHRRRTAVPVADYY